LRVEGLEFRVECGRNTATYTCPACPESYPRYPAQCLAIGIFAIVRRAVGTCFKVRP
jgi:hypothetical protein